MMAFAQKHKSPAPQWHRLRLEVEELAEREHVRLKMRFNRIYMESRTPRGMSLWMDPDDHGVSIYLSPQALPMADPLIQRYQANPCDPPAQSAVLVAGDGHSEEEPRVHAVSTRTVPTTRRFLPARYDCRCVRSLMDDRGSGPYPYTGNQMTPFVRRYAEAWDLSPSPTLSMEDASRSPPFAPEWLFPL